MAEFEVSRQTLIAADQARVRGLIVDFREWTRWSPWEDLDPGQQRTYSGPASGVGARYAWNGNRKVGRGSMEITSVADDAVGLLLTFEKPWKATNQVVFALRPVAEGTAVTWRMTGTRGGLMGVLGAIVPMDRIIGRDFEKGLARLRAAAEA